MHRVTEKLYESLCALPQAQLSAQGARLVREVWSGLPKAAAMDSAGRGARSTGRLAATNPLEGNLAVETAAFDNAFRYAAEQCRAGSSDEGARKLACLGAPVFAASALAEARGIACGKLFHAVGVAMEAYTRLAEDLNGRTDPRGFDAHVIAATLAAIAACAVIENLSSAEAAQAMGLGSSAVTASVAGDLPLQVATAARDGIVMALLMSCGFRGPQDALACRWGVCEVFADGDASNLARTDAEATRSRAADVFRMFGDESNGAEAHADSLEAVTADVFLKER